MKVSQVGVQLFTVKDHCKTSADLAATAKKIHDIGYRAVQVSAIGDIAPEEVAKIMKDAGLAIGATHEPGAMILDQPERVIDKLRRMGCNFTAYPYLQGAELASAEEFQRFIRKLDAAAAKFEAAGLQLGYHNHELEFYKADGVTVLDYIYQHCSHIVGEIDTYWIQYGGGDCVEWCRKLRGRLPVMHIKDYKMTLERKPMYCEIGQGTLPFDRIIGAAEESGCRWFFVEQDSCPGDPFESLRISYDFISKNLVR
ncbi:MAG: sugar phosphate isomerase/epimerase [Opitutaceae bacterium]|jgi:sugar phosphate isomerase/epimerase